MQPSAPELALATDEVVRLRERVAELERQLAVAATRETVHDEQQRSRETLSFLAEASTVLASSLDYEETLAHLARVAVPGIADWCAIDLKTSSGGLERLAVAHVDPEKLALADEIYRRWPPDPNAPTGVPNVLRTGKPEMTAVITEEMVRAGIEDAELRDLFLRIGLSSLMIVPLIARGRALGALTLAAAESGRSFTAADLRMAEDVAQRAGVAIDNAELYRELASQRETLASQARLIDLAHEAIIVRDPVGHVISWNRGAEELYGFSAAEALAQITHELLATRLADSGEPFVDEQERALSATGMWEGELLHTRSDGQQIVVESRQMAVNDETGQRVRILEINRDVTARKEAELALRASEQRFRDLADAMPLLIWMADPTGEMISTNQPWRNYTGLAHNELGPESWARIVHPDDIAPTAERWAVSLATNKPFEIEQRVRGADGVFRWYLVRARAVRDDAGNVAYWVGTNTYIEGQKRNEETLREHTASLARLTRQLEERNRELDQFAYITSHDLKAPLRGMANLAQWIEEDLGDTVTAEVRQQFELLRGRAHRMEALIDGILQYSRVGRVGERPQPVDVALLLDDVIDLLAPPAGTVTVEPGIPTLVTERVPLQQVFHNLIGNALKHGGPDVRVTISCNEQDGAYAFTVADNGPGIAPQYHERIFGIFQTLASRDRVEGSGLGLALVRKIVDHRGGQVFLDSAEGQGAAFTFTWPREPAREQKRR